VIAQGLHSAANRATNQRAFQRLVVIDCSAGDRTYDCASRLAVMMAMMPRSRECAACRHHQGKAEHGCLNSSVVCGHVISTSDHK
jgi:hypothetical protein